MKEYYPTPEIILNTIRRNPKFPRKELAKIADITLRGVKYYLRKFTKVGIIAHIGSSQKGRAIRKISDYMLPFC